MEMHHDNPEAVVDMLRFLYKLNPFSCQSTNMMHTWPGACSSVQMLQKLRLIEIADKYRVNALASTVWIAIQHNTNYFITPNGHAEMFLLCMPMIYR